MLALAAPVAARPSFLLHTHRQGCASGQAASSSLRLRPAPARHTAPPAPRQLPLPTALPGTEPPDLPIDDATRSELPQWLTLAGYAGTLLAHRAGYFG